jgi:hypothetical protein
MSFDALTIGGVLLALISGGLLVGIVSHNDRRSERSQAVSNGRPATLGQGDS